MELTQHIRTFGQLSPIQHLEWASTRLPPWVALGLVLVLAWQLASLVWAMWPRQEGGAVAVQGDVPARATSSQDLSAFGATIKSARLFGASQAQTQAPPPSAAVDAPETRLRLVLKGTVSNREQSQAFAIIGEDGGGDDKAYWVGDSMPGNATLHSVYPDKVLLNRAGKLETLTLKTLKDKQPTNRRTAARPTVSRSTSNPSGLRDLRQKLVSNPAQITEIIRPQPVFANGQQIGYRVYPGRDRSRFTSLGLRPGDLVTEINGTALNDPSQGQQLFQQISQSDVINLTVKRGGQTQTLTLRMNE